MKEYNDTEKAGFFCVLVLYCVVDVHFKFSLPVTVSLFAIFLVSTPRIRKPTLDSQEQEIIERITCLRASNLKRNGLMMIVLNYDIWKLNLIKLHPTKIKQVQSMYILYALLVIYYF
eukprot:UN27640